MSEPLQYEHRSLTQAHKWKRRIVLLAVAITLAILAVLRGPAIYHRLQVLYWQRECLTHVMPVTTVFDGRKMTAAGVVPAVDKYFNLIGLRAIPRPDKFVVFVHGRTSPGGNVRLVVVQMIAARMNLLEAAAIKPGGLLNEPSMPITANRDLSLADSDLLQCVYGGQADPADPSHFTIDIQVGDQTVKVDGWLRDDDVVLLEYRNTIPIPPPSSSPALSR